MKKVVVIFPTCKVKRNVLQLITATIRGAQVVSTSNSPLLGSNKKAALQNEIGTLFFLLNLTTSKGHLMHIVPKSNDCRFDES